MPQFMSMEDILDLAIQQEEASSRFYQDLAAKVESAWMRPVFLQFAKEEQGHKARLEQVKSGKQLPTLREPVSDLKLADYLVAPDPDSVLDYQQILILAMKREKASFRLYSELADSVGNSELSNLLLSLAQEEARHKLRFEVEYDDVFLAEN